MRKRPGTEAATATSRAGTMANARSLALLALAACAATAPMGSSSPDLAGQPAAESLEGPGAGPAVLPEPRPGSQARGGPGSSSSPSTAGSARADAVVDAVVDGPVAVLPAPAALPASTGASAVGSPARGASCSALDGAHALKRSALLRVLDAGLGTWLGAVEVEPKIVRGRFEGWLLRSLHAGEACWADVDLRPGDVVSRVNHRSVEKPEQAHAVWSALRHAREISVDFVRGAKGHTLRFAIIDDTTGAGAIPIPLWSTTTAVAAR
jgi:hypothetical protein